MSTNQRNGFIAAGCWTLDYVKLVADWPNEEELSYISSTEQQGGGSGHNFAVDIKKLDPEMPVEAIGLVGEDSAGDFLLSQASSLGIDTQQLHQCQELGTSYTDVLSVVSTGKRTFFHYSGSNDLITPEHFEFSHSNCKWLHLGLLGVHKILDSRWQDDENGWVTVLKKAKDAGLQTNVELVSIAAERNRQLCLPCLPYLDSLIVNDQEIGSLAAIQTINNGQTLPDACLEAALKVLRLGGDAGCLKLVVVHYPAGAICVTADGQQLSSRSCTVDPASIAGAAGAGDAFAAGMLYAVHENWPLENALELAHATAAASLRSATTVGAVEDIDTVLALAGISKPTGYATQN